MATHLDLREPSSHEEEKLGLLNEQAASDTASEGDFFDVKPVSNYKTPRWAMAVSLPFIYIRSMPWWTIITRFFIFLIPSFFQGRQVREQIRPAKLSPTAYLDGMRGTAAFVVFFCHYFYQAFTIAESYGAGENNYHILKLPILRLWYQGPPAVCLFFVISGYALSYRPLKLVRSRSYSDFSTAVSSLVFRRAIRLYMPTAISTFLIICLLRVGAYEWTRDFANDKTYMKNIVETHPIRMESAYEQWKDWALHMFRFIHVFNWDLYGGSTSYDVHLWTIPVEFRCSLYLFLTIVGTARLQTRFRFLTVVSVLLFTYRYSRWELVLFFCGMLLAEMDLIRGAHTTPAAPELPLQEKQPPRRRRVWSLLWSFISLVALYLMSQPDVRGEITPGWVYLTSIIPKWWSEQQYRYWQSIGAVIFTLAVGYCPTWQRFFNTAVVQYLGKISYALYLMHGPAMHCIGYHWEKWAYGVTGVEGYWYNAGFVLGSVFCIPTVIWCADIFWRAVDIPTVKFAKWMESKLIVKT